MDRAGAGSGPAWQPPASRDCDDFVGVEHPPRWSRPDRVRGDRAWRAPRSIPTPAAASGHMTNALLAAVAIEKSFDAVRALSGVDLELQAGERLGIIGPNGSGKTTMINCITGVLQPDRGRIRFASNDITALPPHRRARLGIARTFQIPQPFTGLTVLENLLVPLDYLGQSLDRHHRADEVLRSVDLHGRRHDPSEALSLVELRKLELARA